MSPGRKPCRPARRARGRGPPMWTCPRLRYPRRKGGLEHGGGRDGAGRAPRVERSRDARRALRRTEKACEDGEGGGQNGVDCFFIALTCFANFAGYSVHALRASAADAIQALVNDGTYGLRIPTTTVLACGGNKSYNQLVARTRGSGWGSLLHVRLSSVPRARRFPSPHPAASLDHHPSRFHPPPFSGRRACPRHEDRRH